MYGEAIVCESVEIGSTGRPLAFDAYGNKVEVTLSDEGSAVAFDADGNQIEFSECDETAGEFSSIIIRRNELVIAEAISRLIHQVWYNRHLAWKENVLAGEEPKGCPKIRKEALRQELNMRKKFGDEFILPEDDFEWGMINGKLSALRWVLGENWDYLDT